MKGGVDKEEILHSQFAFHWERGKGSSAFGLIHRIPHFGEHLIWGMCRHMLDKWGVGRLLCYLNLEQKGKVANGSGADLGWIMWSSVIGCFGVTSHVLHG